MACSTRSRYNYWRVSTSALSKHSNYKQFPLARTTEVLTICEVAKWNALAPTIDIKLCFPIIITRHRWSWAKQSHHGKSGHRMEWKRLMTPNDRKESRHHRTTRTWFYYWWHKARHVWRVKSSLALTNESGHVAMQWRRQAIERTPTMVRQPRTISFNI